MNGSGLYLQTHECVMSVFCVCRINAFALFALLSPIQPQYISNVELFLRSLTDHMHTRRPGSLVIWYDSITQSGQLQWQNGLNSQNL